MKDSSYWMMNHRIFNQINQKWVPLEVDIFADRLNTQLPQYMCWHPYPLSMGTDAFQIKMAKGERVCIPPFLCDNKMLSKTAEGKGRDCNNISSMANSAI